MAMPDYHLSQILIICEIIFKGKSKMPPVMVCKTIHQYSKEAVSAADMEKLREIAEDYRTVKNYVYERYGGIASLSKIYPGYTVQNEMTAGGLRQELGLPSVYFYLAVFDALGDIKSQWSRTKTKVLKLTGKNESLNPEEKHYLRFLLKTGNAFDAVLNQKQVMLPAEIQKRHNELAGRVDAGKLHRYLRRQVRKYHVRQHTDLAAGFSISERAYRYADHGIYISTKQSRKRVFVALTDNNRYASQLYIKLYPGECKIEIMVPVNVAVRTHADYTNQVGVAMGMFVMLTTDRGNRYGEELGAYQSAYAEWMRQQTVSYSRNRADNPGGQKYYTKKRRYVEQMHSYINRELNRFFREEKPQIIYMVKLPAAQPGGFNREINNSVTLWQRGYIRERLTQKSREQSVEIVEVLGKNISRECSRCGAPGRKKDGVCVCGSCGYTAVEKTNTAENVLKRGREGKIIR